MNYKAALFKAARVSDTERVQVCLSKGADINSKDNCYDDYTALHYSVCKGYLELSRLLLVSGANVKQRNKNGGNALQMAIMYASHSSAVMLIVDLLLAHGAYLTTIYTNMLISEMSKIY